MLLESLESRELLNVDWRNPLDHLDINRDTFLSSNDVLVIINDINRNGPRTLPSSYDASRPYYDANGDGSISPQDALNVINYLNTFETPQRDVVEGGSYDTIQDLNITVGQQDGSRLYRMRIEAEFAGPQRPGLIPDWFSVYVVNPTQTSRTLLDRGTNGTSIFSLSPTGYEVANEFARWDGQILEIDLSTLNTIDTARLRMQLLDGNGVASSTVRVRPVTNAIDPDHVHVDPFDGARQLVAAGPAVELASWTVSTTVEPVVRNVRFERSTGQMVAEVSVQNRGEPIGRNVALLLPQLPDGVSLQNASGTDAQGRPYVNLLPTIRSGGLASQAESAAVELRFANPGRLPLSLATQVLVGASNRAPQLPVIAAQTLMPGENRLLALNATDADGDRLTYTIRAAAGTTAIPTLSVDGSTGTLTLAPTPSELGSYNLEVVVSDGVASAVQALAVQVIPDTVTTTRVEGRVLEVDGSPIVGMTVEIGGVQTTTGATGRFLLDLGSGPLASETLRIRGENYRDPQRPDVLYPFIAEKLPFMFGRELYAGFNNVLARPIYLPRLNPGTPVIPTADSVIEAPLRPGAEPVVVEVAAGSLLTQQGTPFTGNLSITEVPVERTPASLPPDLLPDFLVTIQPGEMTFTAPAPLSFPNTGGWAPGTRMDLWSINPTTGEFEVVGQMVVSADGQTIDTIDGGIRNSSWHFPAPPPPEPRDPNEDPENKDDECNRDEDCMPATSSVALHSGAVLEAHDLVTYQSQGEQRGIRLHYNSQHADPRPIVHFGFDNTVANENERFVARLSFSNGSWTQQVPGFAGGMGLRGGEHFWNVPAAGGSIVAALQGDLRSMPSGFYQYTISSGILRLNEGRFSGSLARSAGQVVHVNAIESPVGAGWQIGTTQRLIRHDDGSVLLLDGKGLSLGYHPLTSNSNTYQSPAGDFSQLIRLTDGSYQRTMPDQTVYRYAIDGYLQSVTDRNGNQTRHIYESGRLTKIIDPVGLETTFAYTGSRISSITDPAGRVTRLEHDAAGNLTRIIDPDGSSRQFRYDANHHLISETDQRGATEETQYGFHGRAVGSIRKDGSQLAFHPLQTQVLLPPDATIDPLAAPVVALARDVSIVQTTQANGQVVTTTLDRAGQLVTREDSLGPMARRERNGDNLIGAITDSRGNSTSFAYDSRGNILSTVDSLSSSSVVIRGEIDVPGTTREYRFSIQEDTTLYLDLIKGDWQFEWRLTGPQGTVAYSSFMYWFTETLIPVVAGDYVLTIDPLYDVVGDFEFRLLDLAAALPISLGSSVLAAFDLPNSILLYQFDATAGQRLRLDLPSLENFSWGLLDPYNAPWRIYNSFGTLTVPRSGTYTIVLNHYLFEPSDEVLTARFGIYPVSGSSSDPWTGTALILGESTSGTIGLPGAEQHYLFTLDSKRQLYLDSQTNSENLRWTLEGPAGVLVDREPFNQVREELIGSVVPGAYRLTITGWAATTGNYRFALHDLSAGTEISPGTAVSATLDPANEALLYRFTADAGSRFFFDSLATAQVAATWKLIDPYGTTVFDRGFGDVDTQTLTRTGVYTLILDGNVVAGTATDFTFNVVPADSITLPPWTGDPLVLGQQISGAIATAGTEKHYLFNLDADRRLYFDSLTNNNRLTWTLEGPAGVLVASQRFDLNLIGTYWDLTRETIDAVAGAYRLTVKGSGDTPGSFEFRLFDLATATAITPGTPFNGQLSPANAAQAYRFQANAGERYYFDIQSTHSYLDDWGLIDPYGNPIFVSELNYDAVTLSLPRTGTYTLLIDGDPAAINATTPLRFNVQPVVDSGINALVLGTTVNGSIETVGAERQYTFTLDSDRQLLFDTLTNRDDLLWSLEGPMGILVDSNALNQRPNYDGYPQLAEAESISPAMVFPGTPNPVVDAVKGTYRLTVAGRNDSTGDFTFRLFDLNAATPITPGTPVNGTLNPANSTEIYRFQATAGQRFFFDEHTSSAISATWQLVDPFGRLVFDQWLGDVDTIELPYAGTYKLLIAGDENAEGNAAFRFTVHPVPAESPTPIFLDNTVTGSIPTPGFERVYTFTLNQSRQLYFDALTDSWNLRWSLEGPAGLLVDRLALSDTPYDTFLEAAAGTYRLTLDGYGDVVGDFAFRLLDQAAAVPIAVDALVEGELNPANATQLYRFTATAGDRIYMDVRSTDYVPAHWELIDPYGTVHVFSVFADIETQTLKHTGTYTLVMEGIQAATGTSPFAFKLQPVLSSDPQPLNLGTSVSGSIATAGAEKAYTITLDTSRLIYFDGLAASPYLTWKLEGPGGVMVDRYGFPTGPQDAVISGRAGAYRLTIAGSGDVTGDFAFRVLDLSATPMHTPGTPVNTTLTPASSTAVYPIQVDADDRFFFHALNTAMVPARVTWLDPFGRVLYSGEFMDWRVEPNLPVGKHWLLVEGRLDAEGTTPIDFNLVPISSSAPIPLQLDETTFGSIETVGSEKRYTFTLDSDRRLYFDSQTPSSLLNWTLEGPSGRIVDQQSFYYDLTDPVLEAVAGSYELRIRGSGSATGAFQFKLFDLSSALPLTPGTPSGTTLTPGNSAVLFRFDAAAGDQFFFDDTSTLSVTATWRLVDPYSTLVFYRNVADVETQTLTRTGTYTLIVDGAADAEATVGMEFNVQPAGNQTLPPWTGSALTLGETVEGSISTAGAEQHYLFTLDAKRWLYFDALSNSPALTWTLEGPAGVLIDRYSFSSAPDNRALTALAGDYRLTIGGAGDNTGAYAFRLLDLAAAEPLTPGTTVDATLAPGNATVAYRFTANAGDRFYFDERSPSPVTAMLMLIDPYGQQLYINSFYDIETQTIPRSGTYTLLIEGHDALADTAAIRFLVQPVTAEAPIPLSLGTVVSGSLATPGAVRDYTFTLDSERQLVMDLQSSFDGLLWTLTGPSGVLVDRHPDDRTLNQPTIAAVAGNYRLTISGAGDKSGSFSFQLLDTTAASPLTLAVPVQETLSPATSIRQYRFAAQAGERFYFETLTTSSLNATWKLIDPFGRTVFDRVYGNVETQTLRWSGTYTILIKGEPLATGEPSFRFQVNPVVTTDPIPLNLNATTSGSLATAGAEQTFSFTLDSRRRLNFDSLDRRDTFYWSLMGPVGELVSSYGFTDYDETPIIDAVAGAYQLTVRRTVSAENDFRFRLLDLDAAQPIALNTEITATLTPANATAVFRLDANVGDRLYFDRLTQSMYASWELLDPYGQSIFATWFDDVALSSVPRSGTYTLLLRGALSATGNGSTRFTVHHANSPPPIDLSVTRTQGTRFTYDETFSQVTSILDEFGRLTLVELDPLNGNRLSMRQVVGRPDLPGDAAPDDVVTLYRYTATGQLASETDGLGRETRYAYDVLGRLTSVLLAAGTPAEARTQYEYDLAGNRTAMIDPRGQRTTYEYDLMNRLTRIVEPDPDGLGPLSASVSSFVYDSRGNLLEMTDAEGSRTQHSYDVLDRKVSSTDALGRVTQVAFDNSGNVVSIRDPNGNLTRYDYDARNRRIRQTDANGGVTSFRYDTDNNLIALTDPVGNQTQFEYDARQRLVREIDPLGHDTRHEYDAMNNLVSITDRNGRKTQFQYDELNRLSFEYWVSVSGSVENAIEYQYDLIGNLLSVVDVDSQQTWTYDELDRVKTFTNEGTPFAPSLGLAYVYDANSNLLVVTDTINGQTGATTAYEYDARDRVMSMRQSGGGVAPKQVDLVYNEIGQLTELARYADLERSQVAARSRYHYDDLNRLVSLEHGTSLSARELAFYDFEYDAASRVTGLTDIDGRTTYSYDRTDQLTRADRAVSDGRGDESYRYDANGNRVSSHLHDGVHVYGPGNRLLSDGVYEYAYDNEGNLIRQTDIEADTYRVFDYDHRNRLVRVTDFSAGGIALQQVDFTYDANDRRIAKTVDPDGAGSVGSSTEHFLYDGEHVILEYHDADGPGSNAQPIPAVRNLFGPGIDMILAQEQIATSETRWLLTDHLGTVRDMVGSTGGVLNHLQYDSFGNLLAQSTPTIASRYGFTGREFDSSLGLYYYRARYYSPELGRFLQQDPLGFIDGTNTTTYVNNSPVIYTDPTGNFGIVGGIIGGGVDLLLQLSQNGWNFSCVNYWEVAGSAALGALTGGVGSAVGRQGLTAGLRTLSNPTKGLIGESLSTVKHTLRGSTRVATQTRIPGQRTIADSTWRARDKTIYYVESKFGTSGLTKPQRAAQRSLGDSYQVDRWTYPWIGDVGSRVGGTAGGVAGGAAGNAAGGSDCECK